MTYNPKENEFPKVNHLESKSEFAHYVIQSLNLWSN